MWIQRLTSAQRLYLTYKVYRAGAESEARQGAILEAAHDAIITMDQQLNIREFNPAAEKLFGHTRMHMLGRNVELLLPPMIRGAQIAAINRYVYGIVKQSGGYVSVVSEPGHGATFLVHLPMAAAVEPAGAFA